MRAITPTSLRRAAEHHAERHPVTEKRLAQVLERKVAAHARKHQVTPPPETKEWIAAIVESMAKTGFVDDRRLAEARTRTLRNRGKSTRAVQASLREKGVPSEIVAEITEHPIDDAGAPVSVATIDESAAWSLARRKKLGPFRPETLRAENRQKDLAALGRAGFSFALAKRILDGEPPD